MELQFDRLFTWSLEGISEEKIVADHHLVISRLLLSYAPDWIITIGLALLLALINNVYGFRREFSLTDTSIQYT